MLPWMPLIWTMLTSVMANSEYQLTDSVPGAPISSIIAWGTRSRNTPAPPRA